MEKTRSTKYRIPKKKISLIELIVVIGAVAILAGLIMATVLKTRKVGDKAIVINNLKQIGVAMTLYLDTNNGNYPYIPSTANTDTKSKTLWLLLPFTNYDVNVFYPKGSNISSPYLDNPVSLYNEILNNPTNENIPSTGYAYIPTYEGKPLSTDEVKLSIPIAGTYAEEFGSDIYYLTSDASVHSDNGSEISFD
jgi:type II secretory pathway pseudopilin PulG